MLLFKCNSVKCGYLVGTSFSHSGYLESLHVKNDFKSQITSSTKFVVAAVGCLESIMGRPFHSLWIIVTSTV